jgi:branched-chain amino acid aminotransferase
MEAKRLGFAEGIALTTDGMVSEAGAANLFLVKDGQLMTPALAHSVLGGITRDTVLWLARDLGLAVRECAVPRELLYVADEVFFTGTGVEVTPIRSIDRIPVGAGRRGPITERIQQAYFGLFDGRTRSESGWLDLVDMGAKPRVARAG